MSESSLNSVVSFKRQKFWHVQISAMLEGELLSCDMKVEAFNAADACNFCLRTVAFEIMESIVGQPLPDHTTLKEKIKAGIIFKRVVLVTNPSMMCAGGSGMRVAARDDQGKQEQKAKIEVKESERNKNYG